VTLFVQRARLRPTELTPTELDVIARICRAVDGIPLAIELAAALVTTYSLGEIADPVDLDPGGLAAIGRGQARHHQTLSSAIDRSYRLLSPQEQLTYRRLSVLSPGFARGLAAAVVQPEIERGSVPGLLARLVHRSLLTVSHAAGDQARFHQLAPIRAHAARILARAEETDTGERLRDEWTRDLVRHRPRAGRPTERDWYRSVTDNLSTIRATLQRRLSINAAALAGRDPDIGLPWSRRLLDLQEQLAGHTSPHQLETLADFLALDGQYASAVRSPPATTGPVGRASRFPVTGSAPSWWPCVGRTCRSESSITHGPSDRHSACPN
jgi:predicted ATPase